MKKKYFIIFILIIVLILTIGSYIGIKHYIKVNEKPYIIRIPKAQVYDLQYNIFIEYYIIVNPPKDIQELKELIKKYDEAHSIEEENSEEFQKYIDMYGSEDSIKLQETIERYKKYNMKIEDSALKEIKGGEIPKRYRRIFLQETKFLPRDWQPNGGDDIIDDHVSDIIASVNWSKGDTEKDYFIQELEDYKMFDKKRNRKTIDKIIVTE